MNIALVEDCDMDADILSSLIEQYKRQYCFKLDFIRYDSGEAFLASDFEKYDLVFMDIYMKNIDGIETARRILEQKSDCLIVFLTTSKEDIWRAVKVHVCFDYIEKSTFEYSRLEEILNSAYRKLRFQARVLEFCSGKQKIRLPLSKIQYLVSHDKYTCIALENGQVLRYRVTFSSLCALLEKESQFLLCNRGVILNMDFITQTVRDTFIMANGEAFPIRKRNHAHIIQMFNDHQFKKLNKQEV